MDNEKTTVTITEMAELFGISKTKAYTLATSGDFPAVRVGQKIIIQRAEFYNWIKSKLYIILENL